jgi:hypothetical protein
LIIMIQGTSRPITRMRRVPQAALGSGLQKSHQWQQHLFSGDNISGGGPGLRVVLWNTGGGSRSCFWRLYHPLQLHASLVWNNLIFIFESPISFISNITDSVQSKTWVKNLVQFLS